MYRSQVCDPYNWLYQIVGILSYTYLLSYTISYLDTISTIKYSCSMSSLARSGGRVGTFQTVENVWSGLWGICNSFYNYFFPRNLNVCVQVAFQSPPPLKVKDRSFSAIFLDVERNPANQLKAMRKLIKAGKHGHGCYRYLRQPAYPLGLRIFS